MLARLAVACRRNKWLQTLAGRLDEHVHDQGLAVFVLRQEAVQRAFEILVSDPKVKAVLINIFGGIARTDRIARGVVAALSELGEVTMPVIVRLEGTNVELARKILQEADFDFVVADQMSDAAEKVVAASKGER